MPLKIAAWNVNRGYWPKDQAALLQDCDVWLLNEVDNGMARTGNRDVAAEMADGRHHIFATEFVELGLGNDAERRRFKGLKNDAAQHGNAVVSRYPIGRWDCLHFDTSNRWMGSDQPRIGGRMALGALIEGIWFFACHLENRTTPYGRAEQMRRLCEMLPEGPVVLGGDFNTKDGLDEPLFSEALKHGFDWCSCNLVNTVSAYDGEKLDWFFTRGVTASDPDVIAPIGGRDTPEVTMLSDHDIITVRVG